MTVNEEQIDQALEILDYALGVVHETIGVP